MRATTIIVHSRHLHVEKHATKKHVDTASEHSDYLQHRMQQFLSAVTRVQPDYLPTMGCTFIQLPPARCSIALYVAVQIHNI